MKTFRLTAMALGMSILLAGCITPPKDAVREQQPLDAAVLGTVAVSAPVAATDWWTAYQDPQLDRLMQQALAGNPSLAQALARVREAQSYADTTRAGLSPSVSYDASETRQRFSGKDVIPPPYAGSVQWEGSQGLNLSWDLDFWGRQSSMLQQAQAQTAASGLDAAGARLAVAGAVSRAYIELDRNYALADLARRSEAQRQQILGITRSRVKAGLDTNVELREAEGAVPQAHVDLLQAESDQARSVHLLAALSGQGAGTYGGIERPTLQHEAVLDLPRMLPADLLGRRPDVLAARSRVEAASAGQAAAKAAFYPDINLVAFAGTSAIGFTSLFQAASGSYGAGPALHLPLFDAGRLKASYRGATAGIDEAVAGYNDTVLQAVRQTSDQLSSIAALDQALVEQQKSLDAAEDAYRLAGSRYKAGLSSYLTVLDAETQVLSTRRQRVEMVSARSIARVTLLLALGGSFDPQAVQVAAAR